MCHFNNLTDESHITKPHKTYIILHVKWSVLHDRVNVLNTNTNLILILQHLKRSKFVDLSDNSYQRKYKMYFKFHWIFESK